MRWLGRFSLRSFALLTSVGPTAAPRSPRTGPDAKLALRTALALMVAGLAPSAWAQAKHPIAPGFRNVNGGSNMRFQVGNGFPIPITDRGTTQGKACTNEARGQGNCEDRIFPYPGAFGLPGGLPPATVSATTLNSTGRQLYLHPGLMLGGDVPVIIGLFKDIPAVFQVKTNLLLKIPATLATFGGTAIKGLTLRKGGRTGPSTVSWCPGYTAKTFGGAANPNLTLNPKCPNATVPFQSTPGGRPRGVLPPGRMVYTKTKNQFGGAFPLGRGVFGSADVALVGKYDGALCKGDGCIASFLYATPYPTLVIGGRFGATPATGGKVRARRYYVSGITSSGVITALGSYAGKAKYTNRPWSFGGPWTTGMLTMTVVYTAGGGSEMFTRTGSDPRVPGNPAGMGLPVGGSGNISLVAGSVSQRAFTGPNANRGWMTLTLPEPGPLASAGGALLVLLVCRRLVRRGTR